MYRNNLKNFIVSPGILGRLLIIYPVIMALISRERDSSELAVIDTSAMVQVVFTFLVLFLGVLNVFNNKSFRFFLANSPLKWFLIYIAIALLSTIWSVDWKITFYRSIENLAYLLLISGAILTIYQRTRSIKYVIDWILLYVFFYICVNTIRRSLMLYDSFFSFEAIFLEQLNSTPFFFLALLLPINFFIRILIVPTAIFSVSNTAYIGMLGGTLGFLKGNVKMQILVVCLTTALFLIILYFGLDVFLENTIFYGQGGIGLEYTTGRDQIFIDSLNAAFSKPWLGFGFVAGEVEIITALRVGVIGAHNGFISAFLGMGVIGLIPFVIFYIQMFFVVLTGKIPKKYKSVFLASVIFITIYTLGNPGLGTRVYGSWLSSTLIFSLISIAYLHYDLASRKRKY